MNRSALAALGALAAMALPAHALSARTFVSTNGSDANPCSLASPCRAFAAAVTQTSPFGEVIVLNSGGYGSVTITQSVSLIAPPGVYAGISVPAVPGNGVTIAAAALDRVVLRGLTIIGPGTPGGIGGSTGVEVQSAGALHFENVVVSGFRTAGLDATAAGEVYVIDSIIRDNFNGAVFSAPAALKVSINRTRIENNGSEGLFAGSNSRITIRESVIAGNSARGMRAFPGTDTSEITVENCSISGNSEGILSGSTGNDNATIRFSNNTISHNGTGIRYINSNQLLSGGGNTIEGNTTDGTFSGTYSKQ